MLRVENHLQPVKVNLLSILILGENGQGGGLRGPRRKKPCRKILSGHPALDNFPIQTKFWETHLYKYKGEYMTSHWNS